MSRKNLSRTVIEGGRDYYNGWARRQSSRDERAATRVWLDRIRVEHDAADASAAPRRRPVRKTFHDKLGPAKRWLAAQVGRPWNKVYAELREKFDSRTVAGAHVVNSHMLDWVFRGDLSRDPWRREHDFVVDAHGMLRKGKFYGRSFSKLRAEVEAFAQGRFAANTYMSWWWYRRTPKGRPCTDKHCGAKHDVFGSLRYHGSTLVPDRAMTRAEVRRLDRLGDEFRKRIVVAAP